MAPATNPVLEHHPATLADHFDDGYRWGREVTEGTTLAAGPTPDGEALRVWRRGAIAAVTERGLAVRSGVIVRGERHDASVPRLERAGEGIDAR